MPNYSQADRPLSITTPLGPDVLLLTGFRGHEAISELFSFQLDLLAARDTSIAFEDILGQPVTITLTLNDSVRHVHGIVNRFSAAGRDTDFLHFRAEIAPQFWLWTRQEQSRTFQHLTVPEILKQVLSGLNVKYELTDTYYARDYSAQYRESDFAFASRLMEEEGIYYFFEHTADDHRMIVTDVPNIHPDLPVHKTVIYEDVAGGTREDLRIGEWLKSQELRSCKYTLWDHCFELPGKNLEAVQSGLESVQAGTVTHKLKVDANAGAEIYQYPGGFAQRFDGIDKAGSARPADLEKIFKDNRRTVRIRMEAETVKSLKIEGASNCGPFAPGYKFDLTRHPDADGTYLLTRVEHEAKLVNAYRSGAIETFDYGNKFTCIPAALPFRPTRSTPLPTVKGPQTAVVVGPPGETIFCDKYGRVKVQFLWDRHGKFDADSSCWVRVNNPWGGKGWGGNFLPHVGQEVVIDFEEADPDRPIILGRVYNAECMPPLTLPGHKTKSIMRDHGGNQLFMEGDGGKESIILSSPCGSTSLSMGYSAPTIAPTGSGPEEFKKLMEDFNNAQEAKAKKESDARKPAVAAKDPGKGWWLNPTDVLPLTSPGPMFSLFSSGAWNSQIGSDYGSVVEGNSTTTILGWTKSLYVGNIYTECWSNNDTLVKGNYTCRVDGYQEYSTKGDYTTNVFGKNYVTIVGVSSVRMLAAQFNFVSGTMMEYFATKNLRKIPFVQKKEGKVEQFTGTQIEKLGKRIAKVGDWEAKMDNLIEKINSGKLTVDGSLTEKIASYQAKAKKWQWVGNKLIGAGKAIFKDGDHKINDNLKVVT